MNNYANNNILQRNITAMINEKLTKNDKNLNNYLILKLDNGESIFVFPSKVKEYRWEELNNGSSYKFTVEEGKEGTNLLVDFEYINY